MKIIKKPKKTITLTKKKTPNRKVIRRNVG
jgi:hypothetical protein